MNSPNAILVRLKDNAVLMQKNSEDKIYPASLTKMMTAIVAIESLPDLNEEIKLTNSTFQGLYEANASMAGFQSGEQVRAIDLLYGVLLPSGAECCIALADQIAGSEQDLSYALEIGDQDYILISAGAKGDHHTEQYNIADALAVYGRIGK